MADASAATAPQRYVARHGNCSSTPHGLLSGAPILREILCLEAQGALGVAAEPQRSLPPGDTILLGRERVRR
jgi:hypothetical protein